MGYVVVMLITGFICSLVGRRRGKYEMAHFVATQRVLELRTHHERILPTYMAIVDACYSIDMFVKGLQSLSLDEPEIRVLTQRPLGGMVN